MTFSGKVYALLAGLALAATPAAAAWIPAGLPDADGGDGYLCRRAFLTEEEGARVLGDALQAFPDDGRWCDYAAHVRQRVLEAMGFSPLPDRPELSTVVHSRRTHNGYSVENVAVETLPGYWMTGNLYRPADPRADGAAVLHLHGHTPGPDGAGGWSRHGRFREEYQYSAATLARMGAVVLSVDMAGYGDQLKLVGAEAHRTPASMALQFWNGLRAIDFLADLREVDPARIAVAGFSGGATQGLLLTALDERVAAQASVAMVSAHFFGGCPCESGLPVHRSADHFASNPVFAAMAAPRPLLLVSVGGDWTKNTPQVEYPFVRGIYRRMEAADRAGNIHLPDEGHDFGPSKRQAVYAFLGAALELDAEAVFNEAGEWTEAGVTLEAPPAMRVFNEEHPAPEGAVGDPDAALARLLLTQTTSIP
ncbi:MAG: hypothetical protein JJU00_00130 [Opitutales bacterium]|nr:hypothetical protein [Opitutales bacterium]